MARSGPLPQVAAAGVAAVALGVMPATAGLVAGALTAPLVAAGAWAVAAGRTTLAWTTC